MFFFSFPSKKQFAAGSKKARVFLLNYFVTNFVFCNRFPFSCRGKCRFTREIIKSLISHQWLRHQTYLPLLIAFSLAAEKHHRFLDSCCENREESFWKDAFDCLFAECCHTVGALVSGCAQRYKEKSERSLLMFMFRVCCKKN